MWLLLLRRLWWSWIFPALGMYLSARRSAESDACRSWRGKSVEHRRSSERGDISKIAQAVSIIPAWRNGRGIISLGIDKKARTLPNRRPQAPLEWSDDAGPGRSQPTMALSSGGRVKLISAPNGEPDPDEWSGPHPPLGSADLDRAYQPQPP